MPEVRCSGVCPYCGKTTWWKGMCVLTKCEGHTERERTKPKAGTADAWPNRDWRGDT